MTGDTSDPLDELSGGLRAEIGHEFRAEAEAAERDAAIAWLRGRSLADVAAGLVARGSTVRAAHARGEVRGTAIAHGRDLLVLVDTSRRVALRLTALDVVTEVSAPPRGTPNTSPGSWRAWLTTMEGRADLDVVLRDGRGLPRGTLVAVATDHLVWRREGQDDHVALDAVVQVGVPRG